MINWRGDLADLEQNIELGKEASQKRYMALFQNRQLTLSTAKI